MNFDLFIDSLHHVKCAPLPAMDSHLKMAPVEAAKMREMWDYSRTTPRKAGVLALFYPKRSDTYIVLIERSTRGVHAAQVAFPGGQQEKGDSNLIQTAVRETYEEIGVPQEKIHVVRSLTEIYVQPSNFLVSPFLGYVKHEPTFVAQEDEVAKIIELPLKDFLTVDATRQPIRASYRTFPDVPAFKIEDHLVWGATAMIWSELRDVLLRRI